MQQGENNQSAQNTIEKHVPEWFKQMNMKIQKFVIQNNELQQECQANNQKIEEFNRRESQEKRRQYNEKHNKPRKKNQLCLLPITILYTIISFCPNSIKTLQILCILSKQIAIVFYQNPRIWLNFAKKLFPTSFLIKNIDLIYWRNVIKYFCCIYQETFETFENYQKQNCPLQTNKFLTQNLIKSLQLLKNQLLFEFTFGEFFLSKKMQSFWEQSSIIYRLLRIMQSNINVAQQLAFEVLIEMSSKNVQVQEKVKQQLNWKKKMMSNDLDDYQKSRVGLMYYCQEELFLHPVKLGKNIQEVKFTLVMYSFDLDKKFVDLALSKDGLYRGNLKYHFNDQESLYFQIVLQKEKDAIKGTFQQQEIDYPIEIQFQKNYKFKQDINIFGEGILKFGFGKRILNIKLFISIIIQNQTKKLIMFGNSDTYSIFLMHEHMY